MPTDISEALADATESTQARMWSFRGSQWEKVDDILQLIQNDIASLGDFLSPLFHNCAQGNKDNHMARHCSMVLVLLTGESKVMTINIILQIYSHCESHLKLFSNNVHEWELTFSPMVLPSILHACLPGQPNLLAVQFIVKLVN